MVLRPMIPDRIAQIEATLQGNASIPESTRQELLELLRRLKAEIAVVGESAHHIAGNADVAVKAVVERDEKSSEVTEALEGLTASVREFEASHPRLVQITDRLALVLSNMGI